MSTLRSEAEKQQPALIGSECSCVTCLTVSVAKQAFRKQQVRTWKLQQQREQEEKRRQEEEERRKREDEIRRIRDLSNQDEQYNRFMKLVGGRKRTRSKVRCRVRTPSVVT